MPALVHQQFYIFRDGERTIGLALWARTGAEGVAKLDRGMVEPDNRLTLEEWNNGDQVWLVDLVAPFATPENQHRELMMADVISKPIKGVAFHFHQTDPDYGKRTVRTVSADAGDQLKSVIDAAVAGPNRKYSQLPWAVIALNIRPRTHSRVATAVLRQAAPWRGDWWPAYRSVGRSGGSALAWRRTARSGGARDRAAS